jgi:hypothetical protein
MQDFARLKTGFIEFKRDTPVRINSMSSIGMGEYVWYNSNVDCYENNDRRKLNLHDTLL